MHFIQQGKITKKELEIIRTECQRYEHLAAVAQLTGSIKINSDVRTGKVHFPKFKEASRTHKILNSLFLEKYFDSNIHFLEESSIQYVRYEEGEFFKWHTDTIYDGHYLIRSFTLSLNISNEDEYEGGELLIKHNNKIIKLSKEPGSYIIFPSFLHHTATSVTKGVRKAIVAWSQHTEEEISTIKKLYFDMYPPRVKP